MSRKPTIAIIGAGHDIEPALSNARELGRLIAENGWVLITGGRDAGVMRAANDGAKQVDESLTIGILPNRETAVASSVDVAIITDTGEARNNTIVLTADVVIACGVDDPGTASEVALALKAQKPLILLAVSNVAQEFYANIGSKSIHVTETPAQAMRVIKDNRLLVEE